MKREIVCSNCLTSDGEYPTALIGETDIHWAQTADAMFSPNGKEVWICPNCVDYLRRRIWKAYQISRKDLHTWLSQKRLYLEMDFNRKVDDLNIAENVELDRLANAVVKKGS